MFTSSLRAQDYKVVEYIAFRYQDLKEGRDGAHLIGSEAEAVGKVLAGTYKTRFICLLS